MFGKLKLDDNQGEFEISRHNNFQNFGRAFLVLFRYIIVIFFLKIKLKDFFKKGCYW
jgi:hypothetical protein